MESPPGGSAADPQSILLVEDEVLVRLDLADYLRKCGYHVYEAANADEAMAVLKAGHAIDLLFTDIQMPGGMDGFALARWVRERYPDIEILLTSGVVRSARLAADLCEHGPIESKPYDPQRLVLRIREKLGRAGRDGGRVQGPDSAPDPSGASREVC